jgi:8-oxo-dGTP diphosphatase
MTQLHTFGKVGRDSRGRTVTVTYYAFADAATQKVQGGDDAAEAEWVHVKGISELAFDHMEMLDMAMKTVVPQAYCLPVY